MSGPCCPLPASLQLTNDAKSVRGISHIGIVPEAGRRPQVPCGTVECTATQHPKPALSRDPRRAVLGGAAIIIVPAILHPLRGIACGIVQAEGVGLVRPDRRGLLGRARVALPAVRLAGAHVPAPPIWAVRSAPGGVFPFGFAWQPVGLSGFLRKPGHKRLGIEPADIDDRAVAASPFPVVGPMLATAIGDASVPLVERHLVSANGKG